MNADAPRAIDALARDVERLESLREVKDVQRAYAQFSQFGQWEAMAALFAEDGELRWGEEIATGREAIAAWLEADAGAMDGITPGTLHTEIVDQPLVNLSADGRTAKGRWHGLRFLGDGKGRALIQGGLHENDYVLQDGHWRIAALRYHPQYEGDYTTGWTNVGDDGIPITPPHFALDESGVPIPPPSGPAPRTTANSAELAVRIGRLNDEDEVRNLQAAYGYYVDRKMWSDVVDLFAGGAVVRIDGVGVHTGPGGVRQAMERMGEEGLSHGELNDRPIFDLIVEIRPGGREAVACGFEIGMLGNVGKREGSWEFSVFRNRFVKEGGLWKLKELHITPLLAADYFEGWGNGGTTPAVPVVTNPTTATAETGVYKQIGCGPSRPTFGRIGKNERVVPEFLDVTRQSHVSAADGSTDPSEEEPADLRRRLARSEAWDGTENVSAAYGFYIDDMQWPEMAGIFAVKGNKSSPFAGYYFGRERILGAANAFYKGSRPADFRRSRISYHWRTQPVIMVSHDGRSANLRTRLFQPRTAQTATPNFTGFTGGMYPNDQTVLEDGIWRLWSLTIDEHYFTSPTWEGGWALAEDRPAGSPNPPPSKLLEIYPPDVKLTELGKRQEGFRGGGGTTIDWPSIPPMWFGYRNPVSGRVPELYWPDCVTYRLRPESSMTAHGYQLPPTGPSIDGVDLD